MQTTTEPQTLGPADVAPMLAKKAKPIDKFLTPLVAYLEQRPNAVPLSECLVDGLGGALTETGLSALMRRVGEDDRFASSCADSVVTVSLASRVGEPAAAPEVRSIGEQLADNEAAKAQAEPEAATSEPAPRAIDTAEPGARVSHTVFGAGEVLANNGTSILIDFDKHGEKDLSCEFVGDKLTFLEEGAAPATVPEVGVPLSAEELHTRYHDALMAHTGKSQENARKFYELKRTEAGLQGELNDLRDRIKEHTKDSYAHDNAVPTLESFAQRTIFEVPDAATATAPTVAGEPSSWGYALPADQTLTLEASGLTFEQLAKHIRGEMPMQEKHHQVGDDVVEVKGSRYLIRESSEDDKRWFLQPVLTKDEWQQLHQETYGWPVEDFDQNDEAKATRVAGGPDCGRVVKVSRSKAVLGPDAFGLVILVENPPAAASTEAEPELDARQRAAGEGTVETLFE